jgi:hypothetical protein
VKFFGEMCEFPFINNYVKVFVTKTGQENKDEQGKGKYK